MERAFCKIVAWTEKVMFSPRQNFVDGDVTIQLYLDYARPSFLVLMREELRDICNMNNQNRGRDEHSEVTSL